MNHPLVTLVRALAPLTASFFVSCGGYGGGNGTTPATLNISINPMTISVGGSATITWTSNGSQCTASGAWTGTKAGDGSEQVSPAAAGTYTYTLRCRGGGYGESEGGSVTLTVNTSQAAAVFSGDACCIDAASFRVTGVAGDVTDYRFMLLDTHFVGQPDRKAAAYSTSTTRLAGERLTDASAFKLVEVAPGVAARQLVRSTEIATPAAALSRSGDLSGSYTSHLASGYTLTVTIDSAGNVSGADTNGCRLDGRTVASDRSAAIRDVALEVTSCGQSNGRYAGKAALIDDGTGQASELFLSTSNPNSAIAWRLSR